MQEIDYKTILFNFLHELDTLSLMIKGNAETLSKTARGNLDEQTIIFHSNALLENVFLISTQIDIAKYLANPKYFEDKEKFDMRNLYGKFFKAKLSWLYDG